MTDHMLPPKIRGPDSSGSAALTSWQRARVPNLIVIGAGKAGTTALHTYLDAHPEIGMAREKELNFFGRPENLERLGWYLKQFDPAFEIRGESSPSYSQHPRVAGVSKRIHWLNPSMKLVYLVRDPVPRTIAHWAQQTASGRESRPLGDAFLELDPKGNPYICQSSYATQLERYLEWFPAEQILVIDQHELRHHRPQVLRTAFGFLGVASGFWSPELGREIYTRAQQRRLRGPFAALRRSPWGAAAIARVPLPMRRRLGAAKVLSRRVSRPDVPAELRARLEAALRPEVERLRELTGQRFETWSI